MLCCRLQELDSKDEEHAEFWKAMMVVCNAELELVERQDEIDRARMRGERPASVLMAGEIGVHASIDTEIHAMLAGDAQLLLLSPTYHHQSLQAWS